MKINWQLVVIIVMCFVCVTILELYALHQGINGTALAVTIGLLVGVPSVIITKKVSNHKAFLVELPYFENLKEILVFNGEYLIPEKSEEYLQSRYGKNWRSPIKKWDTFTQDGTVKDIV